MKIARDISRNALLCFGAYYISCWAGYPTTIASLPMVTALLHALVALASGAVVAWLVQSERTVRWAVFLAVLYVFFGTVAYQWRLEWSPRDRLAQLLGPLIMAISCLIGAAIALRLMRRTGKS